jgi:Ca2+-transporting ATPase
MNPTLVEGVDEPSPATVALEIVGLSSEEAARRLVSDGRNELPPPRPRRIVVRFFHQLREPLSLLLIVAATVSGVAVGEPANAVAIIAIVLLNAVVGLLEEGRAARALDALRSFETPHARAVRDGETKVIDSRLLVLGDLVVLSAGDRVPADLRLVRSSSLEVDESLLTGESLPTGKSAACTDELASGTLLTRGSGVGIVTATGRRTRIGAIASQLSVEERQTPMQRSLAVLTRRLGVISMAIAGAVFALTLLRLGTSHGGLEESFLTAVALAVAAVPEGLATVVAVALALGVRRMAARGAIVRRLPAVETLGSTTVILTDKTGTVTENRLRLEAVGSIGTGWTAAGDTDSATMRAVAEVSVLCNDAVGHPPSGDPVDVALLAGFEDELITDVRAGSPRLWCEPFDADRRRMTTVHDSAHGPVVLVKGAPETVLDRCTRMRTPEGPVPIEGSDLDRLSALARERTDLGFRVLGLARGSTAVVPSSTAQVNLVEHDLEFVALVGLRDPVRAEAPAAVAAARSAGIEIVMVTGDHPGTAAAIAGEVGIGGTEPSVLTGQDLRATGMPEDPLTTQVYARADPGDKLALVEVLQERGHVVAVTGDGVNDAPALHRADIGVAMGRSGSDVAREAGDMVVTDDNLATIVSAVREGRGIYDNIRKVIDYLVAGNLAEITVVLSGLLLFPALGVPLLPLQLLWINLLTDGPPAIALGVDPVDPSLMNRPPRGRTETLLAPSHAARLYARSLLIAAVAVGGLMLSRFVWHDSWTQARTLMFTVLVTAHLLYAYAVRRRGTGRNPWLALSVAGGIGLQVAVLAWPAATSLFGMEAMTARYWLATAALGVLPILVMLGASRVRGIGRPNPQR